jgi:phage-related protein
LRAFINNVTITIYYETADMKGCLTFTLDGESNIFHGVRLTQANLPAGTEVDIDTLDISGVDGELVISSDIKHKIFSFEGEILGDNLLDTQEKIDNLTRYLTGNRDSGNVPDTMELIFGFNKDIAYNVLLSSPIDVEYTPTGANVDFSFMIPEGLGFKKEPIVYGPTGNNSGILDVRPIMTVYALGGIPIIIESISGQRMTFLEDIPNGTTITIDCGLRRVFIDDNEITDQVDMLSDFFIINDNFNFTSSQNAVVQKVVFNESE